MAQQEPPPPASNVNVPAIVSLALGILGVIIVLFVSILIGAILGLIAIGLGNYGRQQAATKGGLPLAIAGIVFGAICIGLQLYASFLD